ncbi:Rab3 GTPase-activating protein regulatory subunit N-terminus-domain-containing protein [Halteromyces radiatus]|uniref:Rab3 GTPase-activating protein regulatory subunit N-terminus-domain-containing protein n=1 Tax=Halteromyces radiatus TaxID=101107 RepID=UPI00221EB463|nr:Rab3 GTPase-activating protein regulatory subunit N-terminus-domain-containing protein [Halteromyces radiatus]KAI8097122.1 Rab3 GTPase-activating protein regulatory subunit N-terminus-domain-containing protein [Halteromyces radiatus]
MTTPTTVPVNFSPPASTSITAQPETSSSSSPGPIPPPIGKESYLVSASAAGKYIAMAYHRKFVLVALDPDQEEYLVIGQGSGCSDHQHQGSSKERITSILCLPLFVPSTRKNQIFIMIGYSTGWLRVFSSTGTLLTAQLLETSPLISIKLRTPPPPSTSSTQTSSTLPTKQQQKQLKQKPSNYFNVQHTTHHQDDEEITLLFDNNKVISIDGQSLWMVLRVCDGQRESGIDASKMQTAFTYKKWQLDKQEKVRDIISMGPSTLSLTSASGIRMGSSWWWWLAATAGGTITSSDPAVTMTAAALQSIFSPGSTSVQQQQQQQQQQPAEATCRYIGVGSNPMISFYATHETSRPFMSAVSMASYMVSRVASPVFSFAKSWWSGTTNNSTGGNLSASSSSSSTASSSSSSYQQTPFVPDMPTPPQVIEPSTTIPSLLHLSDHGRTIQSIVVAPPLQHSQHRTLAATSDALGRVILWDIQQGHMIRMWKGVRDAHCGWIQYEQQDEGQRRLPLFLVIYSARRGLLKVFQTRHGGDGGNQSFNQHHQQKPIGVFHVGPGWHLVACGREPLGSSMVSSERRKAAMLLGEECGILSTCLLISPHGEVRKVSIYPS